jgi:hypothetical protein
MTDTPIYAKVIGGAELRDKLLNQLTPRMKQRMATANHISADEFMALVRQSCPQDADPGGGHLVDTLRQEDTGPIGVYVTIGDEKGGPFEYPAKIELGHRARDGSHVAARPFWHPSKRVAKKRANTRINRIAVTAIREIAPKPAPSS